MTIEVQHTAALPELSAERIRELVDAAKTVIDIPEEFEWSVAIVDDATSQALNMQYREKDYPTDVLSFPYDELHGEVVISADRVRAQAAEYGNTVEEEGAWMMVHGILHVMGWDHERSQEEHDEQRALEVKILELCGLKCAR